MLMQAPSAYFFMNLATTLSKAKASKRASDFLIVLLEFVIVFLFDKNAEIAIQIHPLSYSFYCLNKSEFNPSSS